MLNLEQLELNYEPFPYGQIQNCLPKNIHDAMIAEWPSIDKFTPIEERYGVKYAMSAHRNTDAWKKHMSSSSLWSEVTNILTSKDFVTYCFEHFKQKKIDLTYLNPDKHISAFEFSMLPSSGGNILPHTDSIAKTISFVLMLDDGSWNPAYGGGTSILRPKDPSDNFNFMNKFLPFETMEIIKTFPFVSNTCVAMVKTFNSWHSVQPMNGGNPNIWRRSLTINIVRVD